MQRHGAPLAGAEEKDDLSGRAHRQLIGYIGLFLPVLVIVIAAIRTTAGADRWELLDSISDYYYSGAVAAFVGMLVALALFLFTYQGYGNDHHRADRIVAVTAGAAALGVAFFPTRPPDGVPRPEWWEPATGDLHFASAVVLFLMFAVFSLWLFRLSPPGEQPTSDKRLRNRLHLVCGVAILVGILWAWVNKRSEKDILLPESVALIAFAASWLIKGRAHVTIAAATRKLLRGAPNGSATR